MGFAWVEMGALLEQAPTSSQLITKLNGSRASPLTVATQDLQTPSHQALLTSEQRMSQSFCAHVLTYLSQTELSMCDCHVLLEHLPSLTPAPYMKESESHVEWG